MKAVRGTEVSFYPSVTWRTVKLGAANLSPKDLDILESLAVVGDIKVVQDTGTRVRLVIGETLIDEFFGKSARSVGLSEDFIKLVYHFSSLGFNEIEFGQGNLTCTLQPTYWKEWEE